MGAMGSAAPRIPCLDCVEMNDQSLATTSPLKRKRGRPRRDGSLKQGKEIVAVQEWGGLGVDESSEEEEDELLGQVVSGVLSGSFDAGYFVTVKPQNSGADAGATLQGLTFYPGKVVPIAPENDVAPHVQLCKRQEYDVANLSPPLTPNAQLAFDSCGLVNPLQKSLRGKPEGKPAALVPLQEYDPDSGTSDGLKGHHDLSHQGFEFGLDNFYTPVEQLQDYRIVDEDEIMKEFEASACMNVPSSASEPSDYKLESISELQSVCPDNSLSNPASQNQEVAAADPCLKLKESVQSDKEMLLHSAEAVHSDLKLGLEKGKCSMTTSSKPSHSTTEALPLRTDDEKETDKSSARCTLFH